MDKPLEIAIHAVPSSPEVETEIRDHVEKLEHRFGHLIGCRVAVELLHRQHKTGNIYDVHVEMQVPGGELVVSRAPHRLRDRYAHPDLRVCLREAFRAAERQLTEYKRRLGGEVKVHAEAFVGQVSQLYPAEDHGFTLIDEGTHLYFHRNSLTEGDFDKLTRGRSGALYRGGRRYRPDRAQVEARRRYRLVAESPEMSTNDRNAPAQKPMDTLINPGDQARPGTTGTGEKICPDCAGTGREDGAPRPHCNGTGRTIQGIGGA